MLSIVDIKAGKAIFTVSNDKGDHYTYKVSKADNGSVWFVSTLVGSDNENSYSYLGIITTANIFRLTKGSKFGEDSKSYKIFKWVFDIIKGVKSLPIGYDVKHAGCCLKCGRTLTTPESIDSGYGPVCLKKVYG